MESELKELIRGECTFEYYKAGNLYYRTENGELLFPIAIEEIGNAKIEAREKGIVLMRYIRRHLQVSEKDTHEVIVPK
jgi:hypothetical protein